MARVLFFDTETTGVPKNYKAPVSDLQNWPRVIQLAWQVAELATGELVHEEKMLIMPDGWTIPTEKFWIDNGFSTEKNQAEGVRMQTALELFCQALNSTEILVAHNLGFDNPIVNAEILRYQILPERNPNRAKVCTMESTVNLCKVPFGKGGPYSKSKGYKWPKLDELYKHLFNTGFAGAHDAGNDVTACRLCFFELIKRGHIKTAYDGK